MSVDANAERSAPPAHHAPPTWSRCCDPRPTRTPGAAGDQLSVQVGATSVAILAARYADLPPGLPRCAVHGDIWAGNIVVADGVPILLDLERFAFGPPEWDLSSIAVDYTTFGDLTPEQWRQFADAYRYDVTGWAGFEILRAARELRKVTFALQMAAERPELAEQARYRLRCIQGRHGPRPWHWVGIT